MTMKLFSFFMGLFLLVSNSYANVVLEQEGLVIAQQQGYAQIKLTLKAANSLYQIKQEDNHLVVRAPLLAKSLSEVIKQNDTIVTSLNLENDRGNAVLAINVKTPIKYYAVQIDNQLTITVFPAVSGQEKPHLSIRAVDISIRSLLLTLADPLDENIIIDDSVTGNVSIDFRDVPKDRVISFVLAAKQLEDINSDGIHLILPKALASSVKVTPYRLLIESRGDTEEMSVNFNTIETTNLLDIISSFSNSEFKLPDTDLGGMTIKVRGSWLEILTNVAAVKGLTFTRDGNQFIFTREKKG